MGQSTDAKLLAERIENNFTYHPPQDVQAKKYIRIREIAKQLALGIAEMCPDSRERSVALTKVEEAVMWANASIARNNAE